MTLFGLKEGNGNMQRQLCKFYMQTMGHEYLHAEGQVFRLKRFPRGSPITPPKPVTDKENLIYVPTLKKNSLNDRQWF
jgi:hypothetical protein